MLDMAPPQLNISTSSIQLTPLMARSCQAAFAQARAVEGLSKTEEGELLIASQRCQYKGRFSFTLEQGHYTLLVLRSYMTQLREHTHVFQELLLFTDALSDRLVNLEGLQKEWAVANAPPEPQGVYLPNETLDALREEANLDKRRDDVFRGMFGGPRKKLNVWGNIVDVVPDHPVADHRIRHKVSARPLADGDALDLLANNKPPTFNEDMKREGARELLQTSVQTNFTMGSGFFAADCIAKEVTTHVPREGIVGTVSSYLKKVADSHSY